MLFPPCLPVHAEKILNSVKEKRGKHTARGHKQVLCVTKLTLTSKLAGNYLPKTQRSAGICFQESRSSGYITLERCSHQNKGYSQQNHLAPDDHFKMFKNKSEVVNDSLSFTRWLIVFRKLKEETQISCSRRPNGRCWGLHNGRNECYSMLALLPQQTHRAYCAFEWHVNTLWSLKARRFYWSTASYRWYVREFTPSRSKLLVFF